MIVYADAPENYQFLFQDGATPIAHGIVDLHHDIMFFLTFIFVFVMWMLTRTVYHFRSQVNPLPSMVVHGTTIEVFWTVIPSAILFVIAIPSFALLYSMDEVHEPALTLKAIGHQWYWSYEYSDYSGETESDSIAFDSYMLPQDEIFEGQQRLLEVDNRVILPVNTHVRVLVTGADVLHSWAIPSLGVKMDGVPGRLNQTSLFLDRPGVFYGQCSELCGSNHGFMPIVIEGVSHDTYLQWVSDNLAE